MASSLTPSAKSPQVMDVQEFTNVLLIGHDSSGTETIEGFLGDPGASRFQLTSIGKIEDLATSETDAHFDVILLRVDPTFEHAIVRLQKMAPITPIVVMANSDEETSAQHAVNLGATDYLIDGRDHATHVRRTLRLAIDRKRSEERARYLAHHDPVTGLPNRGLFRTLLEGALARARRNRHLVALLFLDVDHFKWVNESYGHRAGDLLLAQFGKRLTRTLRESDIIAHMGGDEFAVILEGLEKPSDATIVAQKILDASKVPLTVDGHKVYVTTSIGIAVYPTLEHSDTDSLATSADLAMYSAKEHGRNSYCIFSPDLYPENQNRVRIDAELRDAVLRDELVLHYQPQVDLKTGKLCGLEALIRWNHPTLGLVFPGDFIQVAEDSGVIVQIGEWVLRRACADLAEIRKKGYPDLRVAVNISALQFHQDELANTIISAIAEASIPATHLELELTEGTLIANTDRSNEVLDTLKKMGVRVSIDDFGTGYSSLAYLRHFPIDSLKVDRSFVNGIGLDEGSNAITAAILSLASALHLSVVAEGIETPDQLKHLIGLGTDVAQGFLFSRAVPIDNLDPLLDRDYLAPFSESSP